MLAKSRAICTHGLGVFETNRDSQKVAIGNKFISRWSILETHRAKHSIGFFFYLKHTLNNKTNLNICIDTGDRKNRKFPQHKRYLEIRSQARLQNSQSPLGSPEPKGQL